MNGNGSSSAIDVEGRFGITVAKGNADIADDAPADREVACSATIQGLAEETGDFQIYFYEGASENAAMRLSMDRDGAQMLLDSLLTFAPDLGLTIDFGALFAEDDDADEDDEDEDDES